MVKSLDAGPVSSCPRHQLSGAWYQDLESGVSVSTSSRVRVGGDELSSPHSPSRIVITPTGNESFKINPCLVGNLKHFFILFFLFNTRHKVIFLVDIYVSSGWLLCVAKSIDTY